MFEFTSLLNRTYANAFDKSFKFFGDIEVNLGSPWFDLITFAVDLGYDEDMSLETRLMLNFLLEYDLELV
jgi:hypothetical protein